MNFIWGKILETGVYGNKKTYKSLICRFLSSYCPFLSSKFCGERGIRTPGTLQYNGFQDRRDRPLCHLSNAFVLQKRCKGSLFL